MLLSYGARVGILVCPKAKTMVIMTQNYIAFAAQHLWLIALFIIVLIGLIISEIIGLKQGARKYNVNQVILAVNRDSAQLVDIREPNDYKSGHIAGAINIPMAKLSDKQSRLNKDKLIIVICAAGQRAIAAADLLQKQGFTEVALLNGGMAAWRRESLPLVTN